MKYLIILLSVLLLIGCNQISAVTKVVKVDDCEYIMAVQAMGSSGSVSIIHKANCSNPEHGGRE